MVKHGIKGMIPSRPAPDGFANDVVKTWRDALAGAGRETELGADLSMFFSFFIADTVEEAIERATPYYEERTKFLARLRVVAGFSEDQVEMLADPARAATAGVPTLADSMKASPWLIGPPEAIIETLRTVGRDLPGLEDIAIYLCTGMPENTIVEQLDRFGREVIPAFTGE